MCCLQENNKEDKKIYFQFEDEDCRTFLGSEGFREITIPRNTYYSNQSCELRNKPNNSDSMMWWCFPQN